MRRERDKEKDAVIAAIRKHYTAEGESEDQIANRIRREVKMARIPDEYAILVAPGKGSLKTYDDAIAFAKYVHKLPCPPADFCDSIVVSSSDGDTGRRRGEAKNPFLTAIPGRNLTLPKKVVAAERPKADPFIDDINRGQPYSLIHKTKKDFTLVVQAYGSKFSGQVLKPGEMTQVNARSDGATLEKAAQQANAVAKILREQSPPYDAYVLHTRFESFVCIGQYDNKDDPQLQAHAKSFANFSLLDKKSGKTIETFMEKPMPAMIPRP
jgi:hypothetical protein